VVKFRRHCGRTYVRYIASARTFELEIIGPSACAVYISPPAGQVGRQLPSPQKRASSEATPVTPCESVLATQWYRHLAIHANGSVDLAPCDPLSAREGRWSPLKRKLVNIYHLLRITIGGLRRCHRRRDTTALA